MEPAQEHAAGEGVTDPHELRQIGPDTWSNGHLRFDPAQRPFCRRSWDIRLAGTGGEPVGHLRWNSIWREYVLLTREGYIFAHDCLDDISQLLRHLNHA
jgi:hypothetical protein